MAMYDPEDDELMSAFYGDQASTPRPPQTSAPAQATSLTGTAPTALHGATPPPTGGASAPMGGSADIFSAIYNQAPQAPAAGGSGNLSDYASPQGGAQTPPPTGSGNLSDYADSTRTGTPSPGGQAQPGDRIATYRDQVSRITSSTDPAERARQSDQLARSLYSDMQAAGHDVKWDGDTMVIDGRNYTVNTGGGTMGDLAAPSGTVPGGHGGAAIPGGHGGVTGGPDIMGGGGIVPADPATQGIYGGQPGAGVTEGFDPAKYGKNDPKYVFQRISSQFSNTDPDRSAKILAALKADPSGFFTNATMDGDKLTLNSSDPIYNGVTQIDTQRDEENGGGYHWEPIGNQGTNASPGGQPGVVGIDSPGAAGVNLGQPGAVPGGQPGGAPGGVPPWMSGQAYTPGAIGTEDIPDFTTEGLTSQMGHYQPQQYDVGDTSVGPVEGDEDALMRAILQNPESLDANTVARMKVKNREDAADLERQDQDALTGFGYDTGNESAPWLAGQRMARRGQTNEQIQRGNREVDIEAARTNTEDRRNAAALGSSHLAEVGTRRRGDEALRQSASAMNNQNSFNAANLQSDNVANSAKLSLDAAAQRGDRMALRESANQAAAELGISKDKVLLDWNTATMDDLTKRYGINVDSELRRMGIDVDRAQLAQAGSQFHEELAFKLQQLAAQHETDMGGLALGYDTLEQRANEADLNALMGGIYG